MNLDDLIANLRDQFPPADSTAVHGLRVAPDVWARIVAEVPQTSTPARISWPVTVDPWLPKGAIVPVDIDGKPIPKPRTTSAPPVKP